MNIDNDMKINSTRREFWRKILYKNIAIIAIEYGKNRHTVY